MAQPTVEARDSHCEAMSSPTPRIEQNKDGGETQQVEQKEWKPNTQEWLIMITTGMTALLTAIDASILAEVLPIIAFELNGDAVEAFWAAVSYLLAHAVVQPFMAALSDVFGRQELLVPSLILFTVGSIVCGVAQNFTVLLVGRVIQGIGGGGIIPIYQLVYADIVPLRQRPTYFNMIILNWAVGIMAGPVIGAAFSTKVSWRWCFYINLPICGIALPLSIFFFKLKPPERISLLEKTRKIDWVGCVLFTASLTIFMVAITNGGVGQPWSSWRTITPLVIGALGLVAVLIWDWKWATNPLLPREIFPNTSSILVYLASLFQGFLLYMALYYLGLYCLAVQLESAIQAGVKTLPALVFTMVSAAITGALTGRFGAYRWGIWGGYGFLCIGNGLMIMADEYTSQAVYSVFFVIIGLGLGMIITSCNFASQAAVVNTVDSGRAAVMYAFMRSIGMCVGVAIGSAIFLNTLKDKLGELDLDTSIAKDAEAYLHKVLRHMSHEDPMRALLLQAYSAGVQGIFIAMTCISAVSLILSAFIKHYSMDKILASRYTARHQKKAVSDKEKQDGAAKANTSIYPTPTDADRKPDTGDSTQQSSGWTDIQFGNCKPDDSSAERN